MMHEMFISALALKIVVGAASESEFTDATILQVVSELQSFLIPELQQHLKDYLTHFISTVNLDFYEIYNVSRYNF